MQELKKGNYSGHINKSWALQNYTISIIHYNPEEELKGLHYHENPHLCMVVQGADVEQRNGHSYARKSGDVFFYHAGESHQSIKQLKTKKSLIIEFDNSFLNMHDLDESEMAKRLKSNNYVNFQLLKIIHELEFANSLNDLSIESAVYNLFCSSTKNYQGDLPKWNAMVLEILREKWDTNISLEFLSNQIKLHPVTISKYFSLYNGCSLGEYVRKVRIENSLPLIKNTEMKLVEIAYHCGFADQSHFIRTFKEITGFSPYKFRRL